MSVVNHKTIVQRHRSAMQPRAARVDRHVNFWEDIVLPVKTIND
jgi:hypothetical protein